MKKLSLILLIVFHVNLLLPQSKVSLVAPSSAPQYGLAEFVFNVSTPAFTNPFTEVEITGRFTSGNNVIAVTGFCDSPDGSVFRLRFSPELENGVYQYDLTFKGKAIERKFRGKITTSDPAGKGPVVTDPLYPKHFMYKGTGEPFIHLGCTEYNLLDISNDDALVKSTIDYCARYGFNKIRFLLSGYPRDFDSRTSDDVDHGVPEDPWKAPNYGALPGRVNPLPAWQGKPHEYDFERFNVDFWKRVDSAVMYMDEKGIIATCIFIIEKQNLPREIGQLTENEYRLYKYAVSRLAAYSNIWWDLGNEHNEFRNAEWGNIMGDFVKSVDPYDRLASAHAYADFFYNDSPWADFIITQQYGDVDSVHNWVLKYHNVKKPYVNEEYGYEGKTDKPVGHGMNSDWVRKCHWAIAMAGGYATYGDWSNGVSYFYMGIPGPGKAATELRYLRRTLESMPFREMVPSDNLVTEGYCLAKPGKQWLIYLPAGGSTEIDLSQAENLSLSGKWFNPSDGRWGEAIKLKRGKNILKAPSERDWAFLVTTGQLLSVASVQMRSSSDIDENTSRISSFIERCAGEGARVVMFPECALSGYNEKAVNALTAARITEAENRVAEACRKNSVYAIIGLPWCEGSKLFNSASVINSEGRIIERYHKIQLAEPWPDEGDHMSVFYIDGIPCSIIICHDERYPELVRLPVLAGARIVFYISHESGIKEESKIGPYRAQIQARAVENNIFIAQSNAPANPDATGSHGQSRFIAPDGNIIKEATIFSEDIIHADLDVSQAGRTTAIKSMTRGILTEWWKEGIKSVRIIEER